MNTIMMNKFKILGVAFFASVSFSQAQDIAQVKKAIDAEQYESAKTMLKTILQKNPIDGRANFLLGNVHLIQEVNDSARIAYQRGLTGTDGAKLNYIGLGTMDLDKGNEAAADANFALALKDAKKKSTEEAVAVGRAYTYSTKPNYKKAIDVLSKSKEAYPMDAQVLTALGDAYYGDKKQNDAYSNYRSAFDADPTLLRAKMQLGVLLKDAKNYDGAIKSFNEVIAINPSYGPVYRELAETYFKWGKNKPSKSEEYMKIAVGHYEKYMSYTDRSLHSRMRHADFLILAKDYKALEIQANKMIASDKVNPRIFRYLGYSAYENGNSDAAIKSLESFVSNPSNKIIALDYVYLAKSKFKKGLAADGSSMDSGLYQSGLADIKKAIEIDPAIIEDLNEVGLQFFTPKLFKEAAPIFEIGTKNPENKNYTEDNIYYGLSEYYANNKKGVTPDAAALQKADLAFGNVMTSNPGYADAYLYRARTNNLMANEPMAVKYYEGYVAKVSEKGAEELAKPTVSKKVVECYNSIAASYANTDKVKAKEFFAKALTLDPANKYATESLNLLK